MAILDSDAKDRLKRAQETTDKIVTVFGQLADEMSSLQVETYITDDLIQTPDFGPARMVARTVIEQDGNTQAIVPTRHEGSQITVDSSLMEAHNKNVALAIEYRARVMEVLLRLVSPSATREGIKY